MNIKKITQFFKKYGFYIAVGVVGVGALAAIFLIPNREGNVKQEPNPYAKNEEAVGRGVDSVTDGAGNVVIDYPETSESKTTDSKSNSQDSAKTKTDQSKTAEEKKSETAKNEKSDVIAETFESTTAKKAETPYFAEGDTFNWPVTGEVVVPYTDESTSYWFSEALNQTMRTFGICISAKDGEKVKAVADGKVIDIVDDSSALQSDMPYVAKTMIIDHGNGYTTRYGFQNGEPNKDLLGKVVKAGDVLGTAGKPTGAFIKQGSNIYLQAMHNDEIINPLKLLDYKQASANTVTEAVDMGHTPDAAE